MAHVLIGGADAVAAPEALFSLLAAGHRVSTFGDARGKRALQGLPVSRYVLLADPKLDAAESVCTLLEEVRGEDPPDAILPLDDAALWLVAQSAELMDRIAGPDSEGVCLTLNKGHQIEAAQRAGLAVPPTRIVSNRQQLYDADAAEFPAILKPQMAARLEGGGLLRGKARYLLSHGEATDAAGSDFEQPLLLQPLIPGIGEGIFGFATPHGIRAWSSHRRVRMMNPHGSGSSACRAIEPDPSLCAAVERFITAARWRGPFMMEFLRDADGTPWFMELNGRLWGSLSLARRQGLEYPAMAVAQTLDPYFDPGPLTAQPWVGIQRHLGRDLVHLMLVMRGPKSRFHRANWPRMASALAAVLRPSPRTCFYNFDPAYPRFFLADAARTVKRAFAR